MENNVDNFKLEVVVFQTRQRLVKYLDNFKWWRALYSIQRQECKLKLYDRLQLYVAALIYPRQW